MILVKQFSVVIIEFPTDLNKHQLDSIIAEIYSS